MNKLHFGVLCCLLFLMGCNQKDKKQQQTKVDSVEMVSAAPVNIQEQNQLSEVITRFVRAYSSRDNAKINALINPEIGLYIIYRPGAADTFVHVDSLDFSKPIPDYFDYPELESDYALVYEKLPSFDCGNSSWDKEGFICDTTMNANQLSNIAAFEKEFDQDKLTDEQLLEIEQAEKQTFRVILTAQNPLIFHVRKYKGSWYVSAIDRAYAGCDA